jgi:hypothetical protein
LEVGAAQRRTTAPVETVTVARAALPLVKGRAARGVLRTQYSQKHSEDQNWYLQLFHGILRGGSPYIEFIR